jgi:hypothetical protein
MHDLQGHVTVRGGAWFAVSAEADPQWTIRRRRVSGCTPFNAMRPSRSG